jgi:hypothetical protein
MTRKNLKYWINETKKYKKEAKEWKLAAETWKNSWLSLLIRVQQLPEYIQKDIRKK